MSTDPKYNLTNPNELQRFAGEIVELRDETSGTFKTNCVTDFVGIIARTETSELPLAYASATEVKAFAGAITRHTGPFAVLALSTHPRLQLLINVNKRAQNLQEFEELFRRLRSGLDEGGKELLLKSRDLKISKNLTIEQKRDRSGNASYAMKMESGIDDWTPPETVRIRVPVFDFIEDEIELPFDFSLSFKATEDGKEAKQEVYFKLECLDIEEHLLNGRRQIVLDQMEKHGIQSVWGSFNLNVADNSWSLVHNRAEGIERLRG